MKNYTIYSPLLEDYKNSFTKENDKDFLFNNLKKFNFNDTWYDKPIVYSKKTRALRTSSLTILKEPNTSFFLFLRDASKELFKMPNWLANGFKRLNAKIAAIEVKFPSRRVKALTHSEAAPVSPICLLAKQIEVNATEMHRTRQLMLTQTGSEKAKTHNQLQAQLAQMRNLKSQLEEATNNV